METDSHHPTEMREAKRARKRSRYISPPYTDTDEGKQQLDEEEEDKPPPSVCAADVLSALHAAALLDLDPNAAEALRFLAIFRRRRTTTTTLFAHLQQPDSASPAPAAGVGQRPLGDDPSTGPAMPHGHGSPAPANNNNNKKNPQPPTAAAADAAPPKRRRKKKMTKDLPPITLNAPPPVPKLPLTDIRKNLESMITALTRRSSSFMAANSPQQAKPAVGDLVGEMQGLLAKVDKRLQGASSTAHRH